MEALLLKEYLHELKYLEDNLNLEDLSSKSLKELEKYLKKSKSKETCAYASALIMLKIFEDNKSDLNTGLLKQVHSFIRGRPEYEKKLYSSLDSLLRECIEEINDLKTLHSMSKIAAEIKASSEEYVESFISVENRFTLISQDLFIRFLDERTDDQAIFISEHLAKFSLLGFDVMESSSWFCDNLVEFICDKNKINDDFEWDLEVNMQNDYKIIENLKNCKLPQKKYLKLRKIEDILARVEPKKVRVLPIRIKPFSEIQIQLKLHPCDLDCLELINDYQGFNSDKYFDVEVYKAKYKGDDVLVKRYVIKEGTTLKTQEHLLKTIFDEIRAYEILGKFADSSNYLCKYYGCTISETSYSIIIKYFQYNLMQLMNHSTFVNQTFAKHKNFPGTVKTLVESFALMQELNITHGKISPYSLLVDENLNLCVVDTCFSLVRFEEVAKKHFTGNDFFQDCQGYESPEQRMNLESQVNGFSDVYSLGLVFLQLAISKNVEDFEYQSDRYFHELENLNLPWLVLILRKMLRINPDDRLHFKHLLQYVEVEISESITL